MKVPLSVSPDVRNLEQVKVGDHLVVTYVEALSLTLKKEGKELPARNTKTDAVQSADGAKPGGAVAEHTRHRRRDRHRPEDAHGHLARGRSRKSTSTAPTRPGW